MHIGKFYDANPITVEYIWFIIELFINTANEQYLQPMCNSYSQYAILTANEQHLQLMSNTYSQWAILTANMQYLQPMSNTYSQWAILTANEQYLQPMSIEQIEKIFSALVLGAMLPKPTLVRLLKVK